MMRILGIDLMDSGAFALLNGTEQRVWDMPTVQVTRSRPEPDIPAIIDLIRGIPFDTACVEALHSMPPQFGGGLTNFKRGAYMYLFRTLLLSIGKPFIEVRPFDWQKTFSIKGDTKGQAYLIASKMFPNMDLKTKSGKILDGRCDALLIAEYARRTLK